MNINTRQLHAFILVCEHRSFTKAAEHMYITQSGLSALVRELETQLDFRLFERTTRSVMLTEAGQRFYSVAREVRQNLESNVSHIARIVAGQQRSLRIAASPIMVAGILPDVLQHHLSRYPDDIIELLDVSRSEVLPEVEKGEADLGLGIFFRPISGIRLHRLFSSSLMLLSRQDSPTPETRPEPEVIEPAAIASLPLIRLQQNNPFQQWVDDRLQAVGNTTPDISPGMRFRNIESCIAMVEIGSGHFVAPDFVAPICRRYNVKSRRIRLDNAGVDFYAIARTGTELGPVAPDFIESFLSVVMDKRIGEKHAAGGLY
ncbi:MAG: LysR family transcriptional regulator [Alcaligenaceae bacterium]|nr:LysR family transcriptional regulator [Alcaligenaceae bacterium]